jgi:hypothetical protein
MTQSELSYIRFQAGNLSEHVLIALWANPEDKDFHIVRAIESFEKLAALMGYDITKREEQDEQITA